MVPKRDGTVGMEAEGLELARAGTDVEGRDQDGGMKNRKRNGTKELPDYWNRIEAHRPSR